MQNSYFDPPRTFEERIILERHRKDADQGRPDSSIREKSPLIIGKQPGPDSARPFLPLVVENRRSRDAMSGQGTQGVSLCGFVCYFLL